MSDSVQPHKWQPTRLRHPWNSPGKNTGVGCHFLLQCMKVKTESEVAQFVQLLATPWTAAHRAPPSMGFSRQEYWSGVPLPSPGGLPDAGIQPTSLVSPALAGRFFTTAPWEGPTLFKQDQVWFKGTVRFKVTNNELVSGPCSCECCSCLGPLIVNKKVLPRS